MPYNHVWYDPSRSFEERADALVAAMTLEEKTMQMLFNAPAIERLGVPSYNWWNEALHGVARAGLATVFPQAIGMAATFDEVLLEQVADVISTEGRAKYHEAQKHGDHDIYKGLTFWSPNINIFRDPRWGRGHETYGEDPHLTTQLGKAFVRGLQGNDPKYLKTAACAKHFAVHSGPEDVRHSFNAEVSQKDLWETYLPAFEALVTEADVETVMGAYNRTNGEPCCGSKTLLVDILREKWGFKGHVTSDCWAIKDFHEFHGVTRTAPESVALAVNNGCDLNCGNMYLNLQIAVAEGLVTEETISKSVRRLMMTRLKLGMFDSGVPYENIPFMVNDCDEHRAMNREVSARSLVLLKNDGLLPLQEKALKTVAVIGPNADSRPALEGNYMGTASRYVTILDGVRAALPDARILTSQGCHLWKDRVEPLGQPNDRIAEAVSMAAASDVVVLCLGLDATLEGEEGDAGNAYGSGDKPDLNLPGLQQQLMEAVAATGKPVILVLMAGSAMAVNWADAHVSAVVQAWYPGAEGGHAVADLLLGKMNPSGKLPVTFYRDTQDLPAFTDYAMKGRTYRYMTAEPLYPFGFGLSYTRFTYADMKADASVRTGEDVTVSVSVTNAGDKAGFETVQVYLKHQNQDAVTPHHELCGIRKLWLEPGQTETVTFTVRAKQMGIVSETGLRRHLPGTVTFFAGGSQPDKRSIALTGSAVLSADTAVTGEVLNF